MKTEKRIKERIKDARVRLKEANKEVRNSKSMNQAIASVSKQNNIEKELETLYWVLAN